MVSLSLSLFPAHVRRSLTSTVAHFHLLNHQWKLKCHSRHHSSTSVQVSQLVLQVSLQVSQSVSSVTPVSEELLNSPDFSSAWYVYIYTSVQSDANADGWI